MMAEMWKALMREYGMKVDVQHDVCSPCSAGSQKKKSAQQLSRGSATESAVCMEEELTVKVPTGAKDLVDVHRMDVFSDGQGDLVLGYGLASNSLWTFDTGVNEVNSVGGSFFEEVEDANNVQGVTLMAAVA